MKILCICNAIDLKLRAGCAPAWWQLLKSLYELSVDVIVTSFSGKSIETLWWKAYENPFSTLTNIYLKIPRRPRSAKISRHFQPMLKSADVKTINLSWQFFAYKMMRSKWKKYLMRILSNEKNIDFVIFFNVPLLVFRDLIRSIRKNFNTGVILYDGDAPVSLPKYWAPERQSFNIYSDADLSELNGVIVNSKGVLSDLKEMGARKVQVVYWGVDPNVYFPINLKKDVDVSFYGYGEEYREKWIKYLVTKPSKLLASRRFVIGGRMGIELGHAEMLGDICLSSWRNLCCRSRINLNITRKHHAEIYASSTSRIFELAAFKSCIVSNPINGLNEWFATNKEVLVADDPKEVVDLYEWLLSSDDVRHEMGESARARVLRNHTFRNRAKQIIKFLGTLT